jgi:hypothetical protein
MGLIVYGYRSIYMSITLILASSHFTSKLSSTGTSTISILRPLVPDLLVLIISCQLQVLMASLRIHTHNNKVVSYLELVFNYDRSQLHQSVPPCLVVKDNMSLFSMDKGSNMYQHTTVVNTNPCHFSTSITTYMCIA